MTPIVPVGTFSLGSEAAISGAKEASAVPASGHSFGSMLSQQVSNLQGLQDQAATASQQLATGQASDPTQVVMAVERAQLAMQLASTLRSKGVEAMTDIMRTTV